MQILRAVSRLMKKSISEGGSLSERIMSIISILATQNSKPIGPKISITMICVPSNANTSLTKPSLTSDHHCISGRSSGTLQPYKQYNHRN